VYAERHDAARRLTAATIGLKMPERRGRAGDGRGTRDPKGPFVICPYCEKDDDRVIDSRSTDGGLVIRRRRECIRCHKRYTTYERVEKTHRLMVVKRDGTRVPFSDENVMRGVQAACGKRPIAEEAKDKLVRSIEDELHRDFDREVPSAEIGRRVAARLREVDAIAYIRYASEHYDFRTLDELADELSELKSRAPNLPNQVSLFPAE
jgi:transcriptional repressor NrdR